jgi:transcriptional regulator with XRE-family HTH domain
MAHPVYLREKARQLRMKKKLTIDELAERLALSLSTIYYWVRDLPIPYLTPARSDAQLRAARANRRSYRLLREAAYDEGIDEFFYLDGHATFREFVTLYIAEGYKRSRNDVAICNSDPDVMKFAVSWLDLVASKPLNYSFQYHADQDPRELQEFWGELLGVDADLIRFQRKSNSGQLRGRVWRSEHGVLTAFVADTYLRARLQAWMDWVQQDWLDSLEDGA